MNEREIKVFMSKLSGEKIPPTDSDHPSTQSQREEEALETFWKENLSNPPTTLTSETECDRFREKLHAYEEGLSEAVNFKDMKENLYRKPNNRWLLYATAIAAMMVLAFGIDQFNYRTTLKNQQTNGEIAQLKEMLALTLIRQNAATDRIDGVVLASDVKSPEPMLIDELIRMLNSDPSVNVRLAALNSLSPFSKNPQIRESLIQAIEKQSSSLVTLNICKTLMQHPQPEEYPILIKQLEDSGLGADYLERFRKTLKTQI